MIAVICNSSLLVINPLGSLNNKVQTIKNERESKTWIMKSQVMRTYQDLRIPLILKKDSIELLKNWSLNQVLLKRNNFIA